MPKTHESINESYVSREAAIETRRRAAVQERAHLQSRRRVTGDPGDEIYNADIDRRCVELELVEGACFEEDTGLQVAKAREHAVLTEAELLARTPSGDPKLDLARLKSLEASVKELRKSGADAETVDAAQRAVTLWAKKTRLRELYTRYNEIAGTLSPVLTEIVAIFLSVTHPNEREQLDEVGTAVTHPCQAVRFLPVVFFPPDVYVPLSDPRGVDGSRFYHWWPSNAQ